MKFFIIFHAFYESVYIRINNRNENREFVVDPENIKPGFGFELNHGYLSQVLLPLMNTNVQCGNMIDALLDIIVVTL